MLLDPTVYRDACERLDLPVALYVVAADSDGAILYANAELRRLLGEDLVGRSMAALYPDPEIRSTLLRRLDSAEEQGHRGLRQEILHVRSPSGELAVKDFARSIRDTRGERVGILGCMIEYGREERSLRLFQHLPAGIYELDAQDRLAFGNDRLAQLHGYERFSELEGRPISDFCVDASEAARIREEISERGPLIDRRIEMLKRDETTFFASVTAAPIFDSSGKYIGREGTIVDVTREERYRRLIDDMPIALFELQRREDGREVIFECNRTFAEINGFNEPAELLGTTIDSLYASAESYRRHLDEMRRDEVGGAPIPRRLKVRTRTGAERVVEVSSRFLRDRKGVIVGRVGGGRDVTEENKIREWQQLLTADIGNLLHSYSSSLMSLRHTLDVALAQVGGDGFDERARSGALEVALEQFETPRRELVAALTELLGRRRDPHASQAMPPKEWDRLGSYRDLLEHRVRGLAPEVRCASLRQTAFEISELLATLAAGYLPREPERAARRAAETLKRLGTVLALRRSRTALLELGAEVRGLREVITTGGRSGEARIRLRIDEVIGAVVAELAEFAQARGVGLHVRYAVGAQQATVIGDPRGLHRAAGNLLQNAIKYSWSRPNGVHVDVDCHLDAEGLRVVLEIENYGVPIPEDESSLVFDIGYRGRLSGDRQRAGTGVGLWDARRVARAHGGDVTIHSVPARPGSPAPDHRTPFLTTATLWLPLTGFGS